MSGTLSIIDLFTEQNLALWLEKYRSLGPLPGILLTFMKSFVPPLPTIVIVGLNAALYGLWWGFLYSWIGLISGSLLTFLLVRKGSQLAWIRRWSAKPKVEQALVWARRNGFNYVFLLGMLPVGPFVIVNIVAGLTRMSVLSFFVAVALGKGVMVFCVSYIGTHLSDFMAEPLKLAGVVAFIIFSLWMNKALQRYFAKEALS
jgi:uncharacterized membrane protein YdjX (TVP38/TMEM64 family)